MPVTAELVRLYADYLHAEYGDLDSDYLFVNLWGRPVGRPWTYAAANAAASIWRVPSRTISSNSDRPAPVSSLSDPVS